MIQKSINERKFISYLFQRLVFEEIDHGNSNQPDVVRLVDCNTRNRNATPVQDYSYVPQSGNQNNDKFSIIFLFFKMKEMNSLDILRFP